ncbi:MAG: COQ9 family protein [Proteobacteria bacterium]|nr:COQ9 family protein [Pseudomonadota bacterium]
MGQSSDPATGDSLAGLRHRLAPLVADGAAFDGWDEAGVRAAAVIAGVDPDAALYAFTSTGAPLAMAVIGAWLETIDAAMEAAFGAGALDGAPVREKIRRLVMFRLEAVAGQEEAVRRASAIMALPRNAPRAARLGWRSADAMWRLAGDTAADYNHYTKRTLLAAIYTATLAVWLDDASQAKAETAAFLGRRIDGVMRFEKAKARLARAPEAPFSITRFLGRLRYPAA